jgi:hypothetical protein
MQMNFERKCISPQLRERALARTSYCGRFLFNQSRNSAAGAGNAYR